MTADRRPLADQTAAPVSDVADRLRALADQVAQRAAAERVGESNAQASA